jgi:hypothetical protein
VDLQFKLLEEIQILEDIKHRDNKVAIFKQARIVIQELYDETTLGRKELKFVLNSLKGLIEGFELFTPVEILEQVILILDKLSEIKEHLTHYTRNKVFKVPEGCCYLDLDCDHFLQLARLQGCNKVLKNLINLKWEDPSLSTWVNKVIVYIEEHKESISKKGTFKNQLEGLKALGNLGNPESEIEKGTLTLETANFIQKLSQKPKQLLMEERGWITRPVFISCLDKVILRKLKELGYKVKIFAGQYVIITEAKCYGLSEAMVNSPEQAAKTMAPLIVKPFIPVGRPVLRASHYYWLCFEFPLAINIKMWNFL